MRAQCLSLIYEALNEVEKVSIPAHCIVNQINDQRRTPESKMGEIYRGSSVAAGAHSGRHDNNDAGGCGRLVVGSEANADIWRAV
jgi:hypothetical protein